jgi:hypothetical protein
MVMTRGSLKVLADITNWPGGLLELKALVTGIGYSRHTFVGTPFVACAGGVKDIILGYLCDDLESETPENRWHDRVMILCHLALGGYVGHDWVLDREEMRVFMLELASGERMLDDELCGMIIQRLDDELCEMIIQPTHPCYLLGGPGHVRRGDEAPAYSQHILDNLHRVYQY